MQNIKTSEVLQLINLKYSTNFKNDNFTTFLDLIAAYFIGWKR